MAQTGLDGPSSLKREGTFVPSDFEPDGPAIRPRATLTVGLKILHYLDLHHVCHAVQEPELSAGCGIIDLWIGKHASSKNRGELAIQSFCNVYVSRDA